MEQEELEHLFAGHAEDYIDLGYAKVFRSPLGEEHQAPKIPLIIYGHDAVDTAAFIAQASTLTTVSLQEPAQLEQFLQLHQLSLGIFAMSRPNNVGDAAQAIDIYRSLSKSNGIIIYGSWAKTVDNALNFTLTCRAHGVILPDTDAKEMFNYLFYLLQQNEAQQALPGNYNEHLALLKQFFQQSPFWYQRETQTNLIY